MSLAGRAPDFDLPGVDGRRYRFADVAGPKGTLIIFMCNHCPYVRSVLDRIVRDAVELAGLGIGVAAISSNDVVAYPQDGFDEMAKLGLPFPYLYDESQDVARAYGAACTPDFFGFDAHGWVAVSRAAGCLGARGGAGCAARVV